MYKALPKESKTNERVVTFSLTPLSVYCEGKETEMLQDIQKTNVQNVGNMMVDFESIQQYFNVLMETEVVTYYSLYKSMLLDVQNRFRDFKYTCEERIQEILPQIRSGRQLN